MIIILILEACISPGGGYDMVRIFVFYDEAGKPRKVVQWDGEGVPVLVEIIPTEDQPNMVLWYASEISH